MYSNSFNIHTHNQINSRRPSKHEKHRHIELIDLIGTQSEPSELYIQLLQNVKEADSNVKNKIDSQHSTNINCDQHAVATDDATVVDEHPKPKRCNASSVPGRNTPSVRYRHAPSVRYRHAPSVPGRHAAVPKHTVAASLLHCALTIWWSNYGYGYDPSTISSRSSRFISSSSSSSRFVSSSSSSPNDFSIT